MLIIFDFVNFVDFVVITGLDYKGVPQSVLLRDVLFPLQGMDGMYVKYNQAVNSFLIRRDVRLYI